MAIRFYLMPIIRVVTNPVAGTTSRLPKYDFNAQSILWDWIFYGVRDVAFVAADVTEAQHTAVIADPEIKSFPVNLDAALSGARQQVVDALEGYFIPGDWTTGGMTYRTVLRAVVGILLIAQEFAGISRLAGANADLFPPGIDLNTLFSAMPTDYRARLEQAVDQAGYDRSSIGDQSSLRQMLRVVGEQSSPHIFLGVTV